MTVTPDVRLEYLEGVAFTMLKFKPDKWGKMMSVEENLALFTDFLEKPDTLVLVLTLTPAGMIVPCLGFPASLKSKGVYFVKKKPRSISKDSYKDHLLYGDLSPTPVDQLIAVVEEVLYSLLNQSENLNGWPWVVSEDIMKQVHKLKNEMFVMGGKIKGKTLLPIPEHLGSLDGTLESMERIPSALDNSLLHAIETIIIDWAHQVRDVLSKDSAQALLDGLQPLPRVEFEFWDARLMNLKCIHDQLNRPKVNKIVEILEKAKSCYWPALQNVYLNVTEGLKEANDIVLYLMPLRILLEEMEQADFTMLPTFITKVLYTICFIWATSEHYNTPSRVIVTLQEFCNQIIEMTRTYLSPEEVLKGLQGEIEEVLNNISLSVNILKELYRAYDFCCANMRLFFKKEKEPVPWEFPSSLAFSRMNAFFRRVRTIEDLYKTAIEFLKLEKIELGGARGNILGSLVMHIYEEVFELVKVFADCKYDPLDPGDPSFDDDYADFETKIQDLDRRLATIFCQAFDDCNSIESCAKLLYMCGGLLERPLILAEVVPRYSVMLELFDAELDNTKILYDTQIAASADGNIPPIHKNMPPVAGQLKWSLELQERLETPMKDLKRIDHPVMSSTEAKLIYQKYDEMMALLRGYREKTFQDWVAGVDQDCHFNLGQPLIQRDHVTKLIRVNFSKALVAVLREVKYLNFQHQKGIPDSAESLFSKHETFRKFVGNLELVVGWYNEITTTVTDVEFPLIESELSAIDVKLQAAETTLFWNSEGVFDYIKEMREILHNLQNRMQKTKQNIENISQAMKDWSSNPMFERKDNKKDALLDLDGRLVTLNKRYTVVKDAGVKIQAMVAENAELFRADTTSQSWKDYVNYIDNMVLDEFDYFIQNSLNYLMNNMVMDESVAPLFEIRMELDEAGLVFNPSLEVGSDRSFLALVDGLINDIYNAAKLIPRLAKGRLNYKSDLEDLTDLIEMREEMSSLVVSAMKEAEEYQDSFERYSYLWTDDLQESMRTFLTYGRALTPEDLEMHAEEAIPKAPPTLAQFQQQIDSYERLYEEVSRCENTKVFSGWLQCDCRPFKQALLSTIKRWSFMFKRHLSSHVVSSLSDLETFMNVARTGLKKPLKEGDYDGLVEVMGHLMKVKERQAATDTMFEPLKQTIELLKTYGEEMPEETHTKLQELPEQWTNTKKLAIQVKQNVAPLQANEVNILRRKCQQFELKQHEFREKFRQEAPFSFNDPDPYRSLNKQQKSITAMESSMEALCKSGSLFEVTVPDYKQLKACHKEVLLLKELWDMIVLVNTSIDDWKTTKWKDINVEQMDIDCKKFAKDVRSLDKEMKAWDAFVGLDNTVKNMITSLRAVSELQNPAIRSRHWQQLMQATQVKFEMSEDTTLADLLQLNLHKYEDEVRNIVDKAVKESGMEKVLKALDSTWSTMEFEHEPHPRTGTMLLKSDEVLVETLEDNQVQLQNLMTSKYLSHFLKEVTSWQQKLSTADAVISIWFEVQRTWSHLESIFVGSEDIRAQLPEDSQRFDHIDLEFKALMADAVKTPNVVEATNKPGLYSKLEDLKKSLAVCEKALAEYLETKRLAFPRFYFVSSADLLDILSNGNDPVEVSRHLSKLFDSLCKLKFRLDANEKPLKFGLGMYSKEDEYMDFDRECDLSGQVEVWLNRVLDRMCATLRHEIPEAVVTYEEKPREQWIFDYPAQVGRVGEGLVAPGPRRGHSLGGWAARLLPGGAHVHADLVDHGGGPGVRTAGGRLRERDQGLQQEADRPAERPDHPAHREPQRRRQDEGYDHLHHRRTRTRRGGQNDHGQGGELAGLYLAVPAPAPLGRREEALLCQHLRRPDPVFLRVPGQHAAAGHHPAHRQVLHNLDPVPPLDHGRSPRWPRGDRQDRDDQGPGPGPGHHGVRLQLLGADGLQVLRKHLQGPGPDGSLGLLRRVQPDLGGSLVRDRRAGEVCPGRHSGQEEDVQLPGGDDKPHSDRRHLYHHEPRVRGAHGAAREPKGPVQDHYDWGLRAIKSVLVVAGSLKRGDPSRAEDQVLMRALRDFNIPKIVTDDLPVFMGLIGDLFPALDVPRKRDLNFEKIIKQSILELRLQAEDSFVLKVVQLEELLHVRHSVFVIGNAGSGKSQVLKSLNKTYQNLKRKPVAVDLDPKAVTCDELFGIINPATREWKDGLFSTIMRDLANITHDGPKWIVLDGDIDPMWIESLNTVMDDNKVLTLASNERIPLNRTMRLVFEISHLRTATPATVSRAGILYINPADLGWNPVVSSWLERRKVQSEKANLMILFDKYLPMCLDKLRFGFKKITPVPEITIIHMVLYLLECLLTEKNTPADSPKELYELYFVFACFWAFGGAMFQDQLVDYRVEFSKWWINEFKTIKFPSQGTIFDYYLDPDTKKFLPWTDKVPSFELDPDIPLQASLVHTTETIRIRYFMDLLMAKSWPVMLVGNAGTGKSVLMGDKLESLNTDDYLVQAVPFNFYTTSAMLQGVLEKPLEKKSGRNYGPPGTKKLIYFIDDMNMPEVDKYGTVAPHTLIRQHMDHKHWYDRQKLTLKEVHNCQYVACMNPTSGSFTIDPRLQRHFCVFAVSFPGQEALTTIYSTILSQHLAYRSAPMVVQKMSNQLVASALALHQKVTATFLPTAIKFHYIFNLRDLSNIFQGLLFSTAEILRTPLDLVRLWLHEAERVYGDKMVDEKDQETLRRVTMASTKKFFDDLGDELLFARPNIFCHFAQGVGEAKYLPVTDVAHLNKLLVDVLDSYNEVNAVMNLVLFEDAVAHICRINRILEAPRGNALLVGVGGSGKQSLSRLAAYISSLEVFQITLKKGYAVLDLKADLSAQYIKSAVKNVPSVFLMTDSQVAEEQFLVLINDLLASGEIPGLFADDEVENIISSMRPQVKSIGMNDTRETCWKFFIEKVRRQLKVILCFSPVGSVLRVRARKFPAVVNCTAIDWFHEWPEDALVSVSARFLEETEGIQPEVKASISHFMAYVHTTVNEMSKVYLATERRYNYTTPKTFLEQIKLYQNLLAKKRTELVAKIERLENGLMKLQSTASQVDDLKAKLAIQEAELKQKNENADKLIQVVGVETEKVSKEKAIADEEEIKVEVINKNVAEKQKACETDLAKAEPALLAAQEALDTLNKNNLTELKSFGSPPDAVVNVTAAVMILTAPGGKIPKDKSWKAAKIMMGKVDTFLDSLKRFDKEHIPEACLKAFKPYQGNPTFDPEFVRSKSAAAAGLCSWCINIVRFYEVYCDVAPKRQALEEANAELAEAQEKLSRIKNKIAELNANLSNLTSAFEKATAEKIKCQQEADATNRVISLANRLVGGLASENVRWAESVENFRSQGVTLCGDVLLISAFVSYVGYFTKKYRNELMERFWIPYVNKLKVPIPITEGLDPLSLLTDDADVATWNNQGLPSDRMSTENATILCNTERWPLIVDAQLQGIKWIKNKYGSELKAIRLGQKSYLDIIERAISEGDILLIENIGETVDPVLDPLLGRNTIKKGKYIKIGDKEVEYHPKFRLIMHTKYFNPHYKPEMQAQCSLINFLVTRDGLEDQLLAAVVAKERPDLEQLKANLTKSQNEFKIVLKELEDSLLARLSAASGNFLGDTALVENLETTKHTASEIEEKVQEAKVTEVKINEARENYRPAAERASLLYFILNDLNKINPIYQFSLKAFHVVFEKAILKTSPADEVKQRVINLTDEITYSVYMYTARGLFERDKLIFLAQVAFQVLSMKKELNPAELDFLLRFPFKAGVLSPVDFLQHQGWGGIKALSEMDEFKNLDNDIEGSAKRWKKLVESEAPEKEIFPKEWKNKTALQKLCMVRCMRPDRMTYAVKNFVEEKMGSKFVEGRSVEFSKSYEESSPSTPIFFILSPGVDPLKDVEALGKKLGFTIDNGKLHNVSLGQGQEVVAENALDVAAENGHWVILQNIHLVARWLSTLDKKVERYSTGSHEDYRVFISAEPAPSPESHIIPQGILENAIKITNEPPTGMYANLHKALDLFTQDTLEMCTKEIEFKCILFALCYFHAVVAERRKFGAQGWNRSYPFNNGDLTISINVLYNYLEANAKVPWDDLRYLFGEIMYGGHITDDWDRRLCRTYLVEYIRAEMLEGEIQLAPGFQIPPNLDYKGYHEYIDENLPPESPYLYGLHPNAEIGFLTVTSEKLFRTVLEMQPKESDSGAGAGVSREEKVKAVLDEVLEKIPETFNMAEIMAKAAEKTPYVVVAFQECERMNILTNEMRRSLKELNLGLKGELTITTDMEDLSTALFYDTVPDTWVARAYPSMMGLAAWYADLLLRIRELEAWTTDFALPTTVWLAGFFNPQSFLTAIMQSMARKNEWPLDKMCLSVEVTKKTREDMTAPPREGSYVYGLFMEGQRALGHRNFQNCPAPLEERLALGGNRPCMP
ncbi:dynein axonemal heavy chain 17 isoform X3 [Pteropus medius]|uniref:dynein heavy chain 17, axonemal isoform X3 n=1 Tax=Pteropus vampyrus TaxID=132908 RepID=UPI00196B84B8|nr:dynein heavy chain 17, axonemal isoform X3 [Pteropus giganteus]